ncbi:chorismate mutase [Spirochaetia bacterium]|nr:chorismate mutase [Spirochaetia bacterium]
MKKIVALRAAICALNTEDDIKKQVCSAYNLLLGENNLPESDIISLVFSVTGDLTAINPASALRKSGLGAGLVLFCVQEPNTSGMLPRTIRLLLHCYMEEGAKPHHVYTGGAEVLRPDRGGMEQKPPAVC